MCKSYTTPHDDRSVGSTVDDLYDLYDLGRDLHDLYNLPDMLLFFSYAYLTYTEEVGILGVRNLLHAHAGEAPLYLDHR